MAIGSNSIWLIDHLMTLSGYGISEIMHSRKCLFKFEETPTWGGALKRFSSNLMRFYSNNIKFDYILLTFDSNSNQFEEILVVK